MAAHRQSVQKPIQRPAPVVEPRTGPSWDERSRLNKAMHLAVAAIATASVIAAPNIIDQEPDRDPQPAVATIDDQNS